MTLTTKVPAGKSDPVARRTNVESSERATDPIAPPIAMRKRFT
jgi:hypothetical protein